jgi:oxalate---CoA ligase
MDDPDIGYALESRARSQPTAPALHVPGRTSLSYADLGAQIRYVRERLANWNFVRGDVIAGVIPARPEMALACATIPAVATFAPLSPAFTADVYCELLVRLRPKALIVPTDLNHPVRVAARRCGLAEIALIGDPTAPAGMFTLELARQDESLKSAACAHADIAYVLTTSGTTGRPKLVPWGHRLMNSAARVAAESCGLAADDVGCHVLPMHTSTGVRASLILPLLTGSSIVCLPEGDIDGLFAAIDEYRATWLATGVPAYREMLRRASMFREIVTRSSLRVIRATSSRIAAEEIDRFEQTFRTPFLVGFSTSETFVVTHDPLPPRVRKRGSVGLPMVNEVAVIDEAGAFCEAGRVGEIIVRGPLVFHGYLDDPQATANAFIDGWYRTGDLGHFDDDGYYYLAGRIKDIINRGGEKISPAEIDAAIEAIPGVRAAATFAIPHRSLGEEVVAAVVRDGDVALEASDIIDQVRPRIGSKRVPRKIYFVDHLPRTDNGKIRRSELTRLLGLDSPNAISGDESRSDKMGAIASPLKAALAGLWASVLNVNQVGPDDDFFILGGDSLSGARLLAGVKSVFGIDLSLHALFHNAGTVAGMARAIEAERELHL